MAESPRLIARAPQHLSEEFECFRKLVDRPGNCSSSNRKGTQCHFDGPDRGRLLPHLRPSRQALLSQPTVMKLAHVYGQMGNMVAPADVIRFKTEGADLPWRTHPLPRAPKNVIGNAPNHRALAVLEYRFSIFRTPAFAIRKMMDESASSSWPAICTPRHLLS